MYGSEGIRTFQFHQTAPDKIVIWVVPDPSTAQQVRQRTVADAIAKIRALTPVAMTIDIRESDAIPLSSAGKHRFTRSDVR